MAYEHGASVLKASMPAMPMPMTVVTIARTDIDADARHPDAPPAADPATAMPVAVPTTVPTHVLDNLARIQHLSG